MGSFVEINNSVDEGLDMMPARTALLILLLNYRYSTVFDYCTFVGDCAGDITFSSVANMKRDTRTNTNGAQFTML